MDKEKFATKEDLSKLAMVMSVAVSSINSVTNYRSLPEDSKFRKNAIQANKVFHDMVNNFSDDMLKDKE